MKEGTLTRRDHPGMRIDDARSDGWRQPFSARTNGVDETYCTGNQPDFEKFKKWADTVPYTLRNPLHHWTHLELQRYFDVDGNPSSQA